MVSYLPNPFSDREKYPTGAKVDVIKITDSSLWCDACFEEVSEGEYVPGNKRLSFVCSQGHENVIRGIEL